MEIGNTAHRRQWDGHVLLLHASDAERRSRVASWVRRGLDHDEKVIYTESPSETAAGTALAVLEDHGIDATAATADGRLTWMSLPDFMAPGMGADLISAALKDGYRGVRFSADCNALLRTVPEETYAGMEATMERLCTTESFSAMCRYDLTLTSDVDLRRSYAMHTPGLMERQMYTHLTSDGLEMVGEIDISNHQVVVGTLEATTSDLLGRFRLDLSEVSFIDVAGCRALLRGTETFRDSGGELMIVHPQHLVDLAMRMLSFDRLPHVNVVRQRR